MSTSLAGLIGKIAQAAPTGELAAPAKTHRARSAN
jgi:hypothetical protein